MLLGFMEEVCPHRKSYKAKWMDNEDGGWVFEFQMSAARANQPLFFTLSVFQPNRSTGEWAYLHTLTIDLDVGPVADAAEGTFSKLISAISNSRTETLLEVVTLACDRLRLARRHRNLLAERIPQWRRLLEQGYISLARGKQAYGRNRLLRLQAMSEADLAKEFGLNNDEASDLVVESLGFGRFDVQGFIGLGSEPCNFWLLDEAPPAPSRAGRPSPPTARRPDRHAP